MLVLPIFSMELINHILESPQVLFAWLGIMFVSEIILIYDLTKKNTQIMGIMKLVWILTVLYSSVFGLIIYYYSGRKQIPKDTIWRRGFRSVSHCYSGCGAGEVIGIFIAVGIFNLGNWPVAIITFILAYIAGFTLTITPLMQDGEPFHTALKDAIYSETASITVMELVAVGVDLFLSGKANLHHIRFWTSMIVSLSLGLVAAYPVNVLLIHWGIKEGMHDPRQHSHS